MEYKFLNEINFGETDANAEWIMSLRLKADPIYIRAWNEPDINNYDSFLNGAKFIIIGQKGTGKTAILRHMESDAKQQGYETEFIVFKNEIMREAELLKLDNQNINGAVIEEDKLKNNKFYYHAIKRIMISLLISKLKEISSKDNEKEKDFLTSLFGKTGKEALRIAFDSILNIVESTQINISSATKNLLSIDPSQLVKKANDDLLSRTVRLAQEQNLKVRLFFDEMHFAFRDKNSLHSDAALVRDTVLVAQALNERFAEEGLDVVIYIALRKEFLDQPAIAQADIVHVIESYSESISWEHYPATRDHPIFPFITLRFKASMKGKFSKQELFDNYLREIDPIDLLDYTWSKPRDIIRFFKSAQNVDGKSVVISQKKYKIILKKYSAQSWLEIKSALAAFMPVEALPILESCLKEIITSQFIETSKFHLEEFKKIITPAYEMSIKSGVELDISEYCNILYMMGIIHYRYADGNQNYFYQQYHRGNISPDQTGEIRIHPTIIKALS